MIRAIVTMTAVGLLCPGIALADSDGYYRVGKSYVAYETSFSRAPGKHVLHIIRVARTTGISRIPPIALEDSK